MTTVGHQYRNNMEVAIECVDNAEVYLGEIERRTGVKRSLTWTSLRLAKVLLEHALGDVPAPMQPAEGREEAE